MKQPDMANSVSCMAGDECRPHIKDGLRVEGVFHFYLHSECSMELGLLLSLNCPCLEMSIQLGCLVL